VQPSVTSLDQFCSSFFRNSLEFNEYHEDYLQNPSASLVEEDGEKSEHIYSPEPNLDSVQNFDKNHLEFKYGNERQDNRQTATSDLALQVVGTNGKRSSLKECYISFSNLQLCQKEPKIYSQLHIMNKKSDVSNGWYEHVSSNFTHFDHESHTIFQTEHSRNFVSDHCNRTKHTEDEEDNNSKQVQRIEDDRISTYGWFLYMDEEIFRHHTTLVTRENSISISVHNDEDDHLTSGTSVDHVDKIISLADLEESSKEEDVVQSEGFLL
jgi:hypothetical protein